MTNTISKKQAERLAVSYAAWCEAVQSDDDLGVVVYGEMLLKIQNETGVVMRREYHIKRLISHCSELLDLRKRTAEAKCA